MSFKYPLLDAPNVYKRVVLPVLQDIARIDRRRKQAQYESEVYVSFWLNCPNVIVPRPLINAHGPVLVLELTNAPNYDLVANEDGFGGRFYFKGEGEYLWFPWESLQRFQDRTAGVLVNFEDGGSVGIVYQPAEKPRPSLRVVPPAAPTSSGNVLSFLGRDGGRK